MVFFLLAFGCTLFGVHSEELFLQGNKLFVDGRFEEAIEMYNQVENPSAQVFMNQGIAYFNQKDFLQARISFLRAEKLCSGRCYLQIRGYQDKIDEQLNIQKTQSRYYWLWQSMEMIPCFVLQVWILLAFLLLFYGLYRRKPCGSQTMLVLFLLLGFFLWFHRYQNRKKLSAVVIENSTVYAGPDRSFLKKNVLSLGNVVYIIGYNNDMIEIKMDQQRGWVDSQNLISV